MNIPASDFTNSENLSTMNIDEYTKMIRDLNRKIVKSKEIRYNLNLSELDEGKIIF